jgi:hypothetical protein
MFEPLVILGNARFSVSVKYFLVAKVYNIQWLLPSEMVYAGALCGAALAQVRLTRIGIFSAPRITLRIAYSEYFENLAESLLLHIFIQKKTRNTKKLQVLVFWRPDLGGSSAVYAGSAPRGDHVQARFSG